MTLPAFIAKGASSTGNPSWPSHNAGDFGILLVEHPNGTVATPSGWTVMDGCPINGPGQSRGSAFYRFATSNSEGAPTISGPTDHTQSIILTFSGVNMGTPIHTVSPMLQIGSTTSLFAPGIRTFINDCLVLAIFWVPNDDAGPMSSGETNPDLSSVVERADDFTITGNGGGIVVIEGAKATLGDVQATGITLSAAAGTTMPVLTIALQPAGAALQGSATKSRAVNTGM